MVDGSDSRQELDIAKVAGSGVSMWRADRSAASSSASGMLELVGVSVVAMGRDVPQGNDPLAAGDGASPWSPISGSGCAAEHESHEVP